MAYNIIMYYILSVTDVTVNYLLIYCKNKQHLILQNACLLYYVKLSYSWKLKNYYY